MYKFLFALLSIYGLSAQEVDVPAGEEVIATTDEPCVEISEASRLYDCPCKGKGDGKI